MPDDDAGFRAEHERAVTGPAWIVDGGYSQVMARRFALADWIIDFRYPRALSLWRMTRRVVRMYGRVRPDMADGCPEQFDGEFIRYIWRYDRDVRPRIDRLMQTHARCPVTVLAQPRDAERLVARATDLERNGRAESARPPP